MIKLQEYKRIQAAYDAIFMKITEALPADNEYGIDFKNGPTYDSPTFTILKHPCKMTFFGHTSHNGQKLQGKLTFERIISENEKRLLLTVYFDELGNADDEQQSTSYRWNLKNPDDITNGLAIRLIQGFFYDMAAVSGTQNA